MKRTSRHAVASLCLFAGLLAVALPALAADSFSPASVSVTLEPGESTTVAKQLSLDPAPAKADVVLAIDTTGSMGPAIAQAQAEATAIVTAVQGAIPGARFAVVDFEDYPNMPLGGAGDVAYTLLQPFTSSAAVVNAAIGTMAADEGGDIPEAYNRVFYEAANDTALAYDPGAVRFLVVLGDAPPHSATPFGACPAAAPDDFGPNGLPGGGDDLSSATAVGHLTVDNITLLMISYNAGLLPCYTSLATATGGTAVLGGGGSSLATQIVTLVTAAAATINSVDLVLSAGCPFSAGFSPAPPYGPLTAPVTVMFDETITAPTTLAPGSYSCTVTAVADGVNRATQTIDVAVVPGPPAVLTLTPAADTNPLGTQHCVTAHVEDAFGNATPGITVRFSVTGVGSGSGSATTNAAGDAQFCYTGPLAPVGMDTITAFADTDGDGVDDGASEPDAQATKQWIDVTPPSGSCRPGHNPSGGKIPSAGNNPKSGQNPDGFYILNVRDNADPNPQIFVHDSGSAAVFGPYADGTAIKLTQARGATPMATPGAGAIDWKIRLKGDAELFFADASGNVSGPVSCRVPPRPK